MPDQKAHLHTCPGGLVLPGNKSVSTALPIVGPVIPARLTLPLQQHIGGPSNLLVSPGESVKKGQPLSIASEYISAPVHAPTSGTVVDIGNYPVPHPSGMQAQCVILETDGRDERFQPHHGTEHYSQLEPYNLRGRIREAGIVGLGGAGFPTPVKLNPGPGREIDLLIINGIECEPYITCDDMLMREAADEIIGGLQIIRHALQVRECIIALEDNKPEAITAIENAIETSDNQHIRVSAIPAVYPSGGERQLIRILTGLEVPTQGLPSDIGIICHNVATIAAVYRAIVEHEPLISRIVTITGAGVVQPRNIRALIGTPISELVEQCDGYTEGVERLIMGGPMMGFALPSDHLPVIKTTNCLIAATRDEMPPPRPAIACIRCGECARACPASLLPQQLYWYAKNSDFDKAQDYKLFDCIECGCCAYVCPSHIPLVQYYRYAKTEIWALEQEREKSERARRRHDFRLKRLEQIKQERAQRLQHKKDALKKTVRKDEDPRKAAIQAALERVHAKKISSGDVAKNVDNLTNEQSKMIDEVDRRRSKKQDSPRETRH